MYREAVDNMFRIQNGGLSSWVGRPTHHPLQSIMLTIKGYPFMLVTLVLLSRYYSR